MKCPYCDTEFDVDTLKGYDEELKDCLLYTSLLQRMGADPAALEEALYRDVKRRDEQDRQAACERGLLPPDSLKAVSYTHLHREHHLPPVNDAVLHKAGHIGRQDVYKRQILCYPYE